MPAPRDTPGDAQIVALFARSRASVVHITHAEAIVRRPPRLPSTLPEGSGHGVGLGRARPNHHTILTRHGVLVQLHDGKEVAADVVGADPTVDVAVVRLRNPPSGLQPIRIGDSSGLRVGQTVLAIGYPFGLDQTLTRGVIRALDRTTGSITGGEIRGVIQTDATIDPGNSGGPLLDSAGRLIGMSTAIKSPTGVSAGIGCAVPVNTIKGVVCRLIRRQRWRLGRE